MFSRVDPLRRSSRGVTLLELAIVFLVVAILATMLIPVISSLQSRLERAKCVNNLHSLHVAANLYVQEHRMWPQLTIPEGMAPNDTATLWINTLQPYHLAQINWICPTIQRLLQSPDLTDPQNVRVDYTATLFDDKPQSPFQWSQQPWFIENGDVHGNGNLIIFPDGHIQEMSEFFKK